MTKIHKLVIVIDACQMLYYILTMQTIAHVKTEIVRWKWILILPPCISLQ